MSSPQIPPQLIFNIPGELKMGDEIIVKGKLTSNVRCFSINLVADFVDGVEHNVNNQHKFNHCANAVFINCKVDGVWSREEVDYRPSPLRSGQPFTLTMRLGQYGVYSSIKNLATFFPHKIPISSIKYVLIKDDYGGSLGTVESIQSISFNFAD
ncbi:16 kDa beta-galactoside-binding lectin-like [Arctopsyche grandis]|uniref:16 kDa beta-galactoside-binding lectin-like n=1 Tax=Arctopsyche grandis TaxID=121162 RepID=UPI00406D6D79